MLIFHIAFPEEWDEAQEAGSYTRSTRGQSLTEVGFIHCSQPHQISGVLTAAYADIGQDLILLVIDTDQLTSPWQLDQVPDSVDPFPHIYGSLNREAVVDVLPLRRVAGGFVVPDLPG